MSTYETGVGSWGVSERLRSFVDEMPYERTSILAFVRQAAASLPHGSLVLDVGAGDAPYRELFDHCRYISSDWQQSVHEGAEEVDVLSTAEAQLIGDASVDAVLLTQVLEHVPDPAAVLREMGRVIRPGGWIFLTVPFIWELHELPDDFWRFTPPSLERLLQQAGFADIQVDPRNDCFSTVAQLLRNMRWVMGRASDGRDTEREAAAELLDELADRLAPLAALDAKHILPLGWAAEARRA